MIYKCTQIKDRNEELKDTFIANDFPINIVDRILKFQKYIPHKYRTDGKENTQKTPIDFEKSFKVPYVKGFSDILRRELQKEGIHIIFSKGTILKRNFANLHQRSQSRNQSTIFTGNTAPNVVQHTLGNPV